MISADKGRIAFSGVLIFWLSALSVTPAAAQLQIDAHVVGSTSAKTNELEVGLKEATEDVSKELAFTDVSIVNSSLGAIQRYTTSGMAVYQAGSAVTITATPSRGYTFMAWSETLAPSTAYYLHVSTASSSSKEFALSGQISRFFRSLSAQPGQAAPTLLVTDSVELKNWAESNKKDGLFVVFATTRNEARAKTKKALLEIALWVQAPRQIRRHESFNVSAGIITKARGQPLNMTAHFNATSLEARPEGDQSRVADSELIWNWTVRPKDLGSHLISVRIANLNVQGPVILNGLDATVTGDTVVFPVEILNEFWMTAVQEKICQTIAVLLGLFIVVLTIRKHLHGKEVDEIAI